MVKIKHGALVVLEENLEALAGESVAKKVMKGSEEITEKTDKRKTAEWVKNAIERLDALVDKGVKLKIMENCGYNCANVNKKVIQRAKARRSKFRSVDEFLAAEQKKPVSEPALSEKETRLFSFTRRKRSLDL